MGIIINVPEAGLDYVLYGNRNRNILTNYLFNQLAQIPKAFNEFGQRIYNTMLESYNYITDMAKQYNILNSLKKQGIKIEGDYIEYYTSFEQLQNANIIMQRWIMSHPLVRQDYLNQHIDGYSETYKNVFDKEIGEKDYNYRRVMDGVIRFDENGDFFYKHYLEDLLAEDKELNHHEKVRILGVYDLIDWLYDTTDYDFTSKSENKRFK